MSEFTDCYHLRTDSQEDGIQLLESTGLKGFVFPAANGWVTLVNQKSDDEEEKFLAENTGLLLHYVYAEDHGWSFSIYRGSEQVCHYHDMWEIGEEDDSQLDRDLIYQLVQENKFKEEEIDSIFQPQDFAYMVGLTNYNWISYDYVNSEYEREKEVYEDVVRID